MDNEDDDSDDKDYSPGNNDYDGSSTSNDSDSDSNSNDSKADNDNDSNNNNNPNDVDFKPASALTDSAATTPALNENHKTAGVDNMEDDVEDENTKAPGVDDTTGAKPDTGTEYENDTPNMAMEGCSVRIYQVPADKQVL